MTTAEIDRLARRARALADLRRAPTQALAAQADALAEACHQMARRFHVGGRILAFGNGGPTTDAQHVSVEFVHPVVVGKPALPAVSLNADGASVAGLARRHGHDEVYAHLLEVMGRPDDIAVGLSSDGRCADVLRGLASAHDRGMLTVALVGDPGSPLATSAAVDHVVTVASDDPAIVKEVHVTAYHVLWELVHVFLEQPGLLEGGSGRSAAQGSVESLYPFLYEGTADLDGVLREVAVSTRAKVDEVVELRSGVVVGAAEDLARCAVEVADAFAEGATLLAFGNGGSSSDAQEVVQVHLAPHGDAPSLPALCLTNDVAVVTALSNDVDFDVVFARQLRALGRAGDVAVGLSTSGSSANVVEAFAAARRLGMHTVGLAGDTGGTMAEVDTIDHLFVVPSASVHRIQEVQTTLYHVLHELVVESLAGRSVTSAGDAG